MIRAIRTTAQSSPSHRVWPNSSFEQLVPLRCSMPFAAPVVPTARYDFGSGRWLTESFVAPEHAGVAMFADGTVLVVGGVLDGGVSTERGYASRDPPLTEVVGSGSAASGVHR